MTLSLFFCIENASFTVSLEGAFRGNIRTVQSDVMVEEGRRNMNALIAYIEKYEPLVGVRAILKAFSICEIHV